MNNIINTNSNPISNTNTNNNTKIAKNNANFKYKAVTHYREESKTKASPTKYLNSVNLNTSDNKDSNIIINSSKTHNNNTSKMLRQVKTLNPKEQPNQAKSNHNRPKKPKKLKKKVKWKDSFIEYVNVSIHKDENENESSLNIIVKTKVNVPNFPSTNPNENVSCTCLVY